VGLITRLLTAHQIPNSYGDVEIGPMIVVADVTAINAIKDIQSQITNIFGGNIGKYQELIKIGIQSAMDKFEEAITEYGYEGAFAVNISHPSILEGGCEIFISGTLFKIK